MKNKSKKKKEKEDNEEASSLFEKISEQNDDDNSLKKCGWKCLENLNEDGKMRWIKKNPSVGKIQSLYIFSMIGWIVVFMFLAFLHPFTKRVSWLGKGILSIPFFVLGFNLVKVEEADEETYKEIFQGDYMSCAYLVLFLILKDYKDNKAKSSYTNIVIALSIFFFIAVTFDFWVSGKNFVYIKHIRSILLTFAMTLLLYIVFLFYLNNE
jgi:hypothetical protein